MSRHPSYGKRSKGGKKRNVLKRYERIEKLKETGKWQHQDTSKVTGLPKTKVAK